ncbi:DUF4132 domain-containing protein [Actinomadura xylanilytica]|uniref:DUF4132 domain-containing protein n=1 Tax=Actinomadura xylanilytica TaxID=887459 RepID=UPI00255B11F4|nr:DUF4132 domain-containing protein [Actinomadura xylanilytica]MDL4776240.1 DUF4132 domain-containing protein [Actinomadura xylanilytica]
MPETTALIEEAPESALPPLLVEPPWTRRPTGQEPVVLKGLKPPKEPTVLAWAPGEQAEWLEMPYQHHHFERLPDGTDWAAAAETFASGEALSDLDDQDRRNLYIGLLMQGPDELGRRLLADERYSDVLLDEWKGISAVHGIVARHGLAAYPLAMLESKSRRGYVKQLAPFVDADVAQAMIKGLYNGWYNKTDAAAWFERHGPAAAPLVVPDVLRKPGPKRKAAERALLSIARKYGRETIVEAARYHGDEATKAIEAFRTDPLDLYPDPLPELAAKAVPERLPQVLLRGRERALPASATRNLITMLSISVTVPYPGLVSAIEPCDPRSLAEFAWALYEADDEPKMWASPWVQHALAYLGDDETAARLAAQVVRWSKATVWHSGGANTMYVFASIGTDTTLRHLHTLARKAADKDRIRPYAQAALDQAARKRGLTSEQLADRLVPDFGLDAEGGMTLDYGRRTFRVGFDEQLKPYIIDDTGKLRKALPKPGAKDDPELAPAAYQRFTVLKKEVRAIASDQTKRLERAMVTGRRWTPQEFQDLLVGHPLLWHIVRRLVWTADDQGETTTFRVAEDRTFADLDDQRFTPSPTARIGLPHPLHLGETVKAWSDVLADYEILQPFPQLGRGVHVLTDDERTGSRLSRFEGSTVPNGPIYGLERQGWEFGAKENRGYRRTISLTLTGKQHLVIGMEPGIGIFAEEDPEQKLDYVGLDGPEKGTFGNLDPVAASEALATLIRLTGSES